MIDEDDERTGPPAHVQDAHDFMQNMHDTFVDAALTCVEGADCRWLHVHRNWSRHIEHKLAAEAIADAAVNAFLANDWVDMPDEILATWRKPDAVRDHFKALASVLSDEPDNSPLRQWADQAYRILRITQE